MSLDLQSAVRERTRLEQLCAEIPVSLQDYMSVWDAPELGWEVSNEILREISVADSCDSLYVPRGYQLPVTSLEEIHQSTTANGKEATTETATKKTIPRTLIEDVLKTYKTHESDYRQGSWFHAAEIFEREIEQWEANDSSPKPKRNG